MISNSVAKSIYEVVACFSITARLKDGVDELVAFDDEGEEEKMKFFLFVLDLTHARRR